MDAFARENLLDHFNHPRRKGRLHAPTARHSDLNPFCGDEIAIELAVENGVVVDAAFDGHGCTISQAAASMLMEEVMGQPVSVVEEWDRDFMLELLGINLSPTRLKCALLPLKVLQAGVHKLSE